MEEQVIREAVIGVVAVVASTQGKSLRTTSDISDNQSPGLTSRVRAEVGPLGHAPNTDGGRPLCHIDTVYNRGVGGDCIV
jgi:hypothetical protein